MAVAQGSDEDPDARSDAWLSLRSAIGEFRKRANRAEREKSEKWAAGWEQGRTDVLKELESWSTSQACFAAIRALECPTRGK